MSQSEEKSERRLGGPPFLNVSTLLLGGNKERISRCKDSEFSWFLQQNRNIFNRGCCILSEWHSPTPCRYNRSMSPRNGC